MSDESDDIAGLVDRLDHPDAGVQNRVLERLSKHPDRARPVVVSRLADANARTRRALLRWLDDHLAAEATLPLMRYVFDERGSVAEQTGRSMAMGLLFRRARTTDTPEERGRLRAFAEDMADDPSSDVRRVAMRILAFTGDDGSALVVEERLDDDDEDVRRAARKTLEVLEETADRRGGDRTPRPAAELRRELSQSAGPVRRQLVRQWRRHPDRTEIAVDLLERGGDLRRESLRILLEDPVPEARPLLPDIVFDAPDGDLAPLALRLMAKLVDDPRDREVEAVRRGLHADSVLTRAAACRAAGATGLTRFVDQLIRTSQSRDLPVALEAARSLEALLDESHHELLQKLLTTVKTAERRRRREPNREDGTRLVAHLLAATREAVSPSTIGIEALHRTVFDILDHADPDGPLVVTGLRLLLASTPREGFDKFDRWDGRDAAVLLDMVRDADRSTVRRIAEALRRGAPEGMRGLDDAAYTIWRRGDVEVGRRVVPLLERAGTERADRWLEEIAGGDDEEAAEEARRVFRRRRGEQDAIDVEFIPRDRDR